jgi:hypothetical protein
VHDIPSVDSAKLDKTLNLYSQLSTRFPNVFSVILHSLLAFLFIYGWYISVIVDTNIFVPHNFFSEFKFMKKNYKFLCHEKMRLNVGITHYIKVKIRISRRYY